jgi:FMN phosphatase YigB (HAD superfamily)
MTMSTRALLIDLDGTLLKNDMVTFVPVYWQAFARFVAPFVEPAAFMRALEEGVRSMMVDDDLDRTNAEAFWAGAGPFLPVAREELEPVLVRFYEEVFPTLSSLTAPVEGARALVAAAREAGLAVALATNPVFPRRAIEHRLAWAGLAPEAFDLITDFETMTSTKPHPSYFLQTAERLGVPPEACLMAGNHLSDDIQGAQQVGMRTFFVDTYPIEDAPVIPDGRGSLGDLRALLFSPARAGTV